MSESANSPGAVPLDLPDGDLGPAVIPPAELPGLTGLLTLAVGVVIVAGLYFAREVLIPITVAVLLSFLLAPLVNLLRRVHLGRVPAALIAVLLGLGVMLAIGGLIGTQIADLAGQVPRYQYTIERKIDMVRSLTIGRIDAISRRLGAQFQQAAPPAAAPPAPTSETAKAPPPMPVEVHQPTPSPLEVAESVLMPVVNPLATAGIVFIVTIFILLQREDLRDRLIRLFGSADLHRTTVAMDDAARRLSRYFLTQLAINAGFGVVIAIGLTVIGVPSPILWGIVTALMRFLPYIGVPLAALMPVALSAAVDPGWSMAITTAALYLVADLVTGQAVEPMMYSRSTGLSPVSVVIAATFWTWLWGPIGLILSTPLTLCVVVLGRHVQRLEFLDVLFGDQPALTPVESFYQRMLAGDPDEAAEQAELLLKGRALSSYYDEVAMKGLQLAAYDAARGVLGADRLAQIRRAMLALFEDLDSHDDEDPEREPKEADNAPVAPSRAQQDLPRQDAPQGSAADHSDLKDEWRGESSVLCVAGRGPLDDGAAIMLRQLLQKHGIGARVVPHDAVARGRVAQLDTRGVAMVCVTYLEISGSPAHVRYLLRRLRQQVPGRPMLVGFWPADDVLLRDEGLRGSVGADYCVTSLHDAVEACLEAAHHATQAAAAPVAAE
ncbi:MAG TPA: AI-2E family transporter [Acetobacteraceae bacterium]|nr:AI-2E family transporter [Acetobacteraceae bacterium]